MCFPHLQTYYFSMMSPYVSRFLFCSQVFWYCEMNRYGLLRVRKSINHENVKCWWCFDVWNNEIGILLYQSEAAKTIKHLNLFLKYVILLCMLPNNRHDYYNMFSYDSPMFFLWCSYDFPMMLLYFAVFWALFANCLRIRPRFLTRA